MFCIRAGPSLQAPEPRLQFCRRQFFHRKLRNQDCSFTRDWIGAVASLCFPHPTLFSIWTDLKRSEKIPGAPTWSRGEWFWLTGLSRLHRNEIQRNRWFFLFRYCIYGHFFFCLLEGVRSRSSTPVDTPPEREWGAESNGKVPHLFNPWWNCSLGFWVCSGRPAFGRTAA